METSARWLRVGSLLSFVLVAVAGTASAQRAPGHVWTHESGYENWIPKVVAVGDCGAQVFTGLDGYGGSTRLFSATDLRAAQPVWNGSAAYHCSGNKVDSADAGGLHVSLSFVQSSYGAPVRGVLARYSGSSAAPQWRYEFPITVYGTPQNAVHVSEDGSRIVAWVFDLDAYRTQIAVFQPDSGLPLSYTPVATRGSPVASSLSSDGRKVLVVSQARTIVFDVHSAGVVHDAANWDTITPAQGISGDGSVFARGLADGRVQLWRWQGSGYALFLTHKLDDANTQCAALALSDDGSTLVCGWAYQPNFHTTRIQAVEFYGTSAVVTLDESFTGTGGLQNTVSDVCLTGDAGTLAVGMTGDESNLVPEVVAYRSSRGSWTRVLAHDLPGSPLDVDLSEDGRSLAVASKANHVNVLGTDGQYDVFDLAERDLVLFGAPRVGRLVDVQGFAEPGNRVILLASQRFARRTVSGSVGTLFLQRSSVVPVAAGEVAPDGTFTATLRIPDEPTLIGTSTYYQLLDTTARRLSEDHIRMTVLP